MLRSALFAALCASPLMAAGPAVAQEEGTFFQNLLGNIGIAPRERESIDYRQRAPLVVPPKMALPQPTPPGAARGTAWPTDPDVIARREAARRAGKPVVDGEDGRDLRDPKMTPEQLRAVRSARNANVPPGGYGPLWGERGQATVVVSPDELRKVTSRADEPDLKPGEMPTRRRLTDPPGTLRRATQAIAPKSEPVERPDEADPKKFIREEALRR